MQGVWFRESMRREAERLGVAGWVRNQPDGSVEAVMQGTDEAVAALVAWAKKGPPLARVEHLELSEAAGEFTAFEKRND